MERCLFVKKVMPKTSVSYAHHLKKLCPPLYKVMAITFSSLPNNLPSHGHNFFLFISKIAKEYFGKTSGWLYHRLKGTLINGKPVKFTDEQKNKLADAFEELSKEFNKASVILRSVS
jgi:hypothetical protein